MIGLKYRDGRLKKVESIGMMSLDYTLLNEDVETIVVVDEKTKKEKQFCEVDVINGAA